MISLKNQVKIYGMIALIMIILMPFLIYYFYQIHILKYFLIASCIEVALVGFLIGLLIIDLKLSRTLKKEKKNLSQNLSLNITSILKDGDYYELIHETNSFWNVIIRMIIKGKNKEKYTGIKDASLTRKDVKKIALWLKDNPHITLYTVTHERIIEILELVGKESIVLIKMDREKKINYITWWKLTFKTQGNIKIKKPKAFYRYKIQLKNS